VTRDTRLKGSLHGFGESAESSEVVLHPDTMLPVVVYEVADQEGAEDEATDEQRHAQQHQEAVADSERTYIATRGPGGVNGDVNTILSHQACASFYLQNNVRLRWIVLVHAQVAPQEADDNR
jgi:hypothetical protein